MKLGSLYRLPVALAVSAIVAMAAVIASANDDYNNRARKNKAEYYLYESQSAYSSLDYAKYLLLVERAYDIDSMNPGIAGEWGVINYRAAEGDTALEHRAYESLRRSFLGYSGNYFTGVRFAKLASSLGNYDDAIATWMMLDSLFPGRSEPLLSLAGEYLEKFEMTSDTADFDKAIKIYERFELGGKTTSSVSNKIGAYYAIGDTLAMISNLQELDSIAPDDNSVAWFIGSVYELLDDIDMAMKYYGKAIDLDPTDGRALDSRASLFLSQGDTAAYCQQIYRAVKESDLDVDSKLELTRSFMMSMYTDSTMIEPTIELFESLEDQYPGEAAVPQMFSMYLTIVERLPMAIEQLYYLKKIDPNNSETDMSLITLLDQTDQTSDAIALAEESIKKYPDDLSFPIRLAHIYVSNDNPSKGVEVLDSVKIDNVYNPEAVASFYMVKGDLLCLAGDTIRGLAAYDQSLDLHYENALVLNNAAYFLSITGGDLDKAERYALKAIKLEEDNPTYLDTYAWVLFKREEYIMAKVYIDAALDILKEKALSALLSELEEAPEQPAEEPSNADSEGDSIGAPVPKEDITPPKSLNDRLKNEMNIETSGDDNTEPYMTTEEAEAELKKLLAAFASLYDGSSEIFDHAGDIYYMCGDVDNAMHYWENAFRLDTENKRIENKIKNRSIE